MNGKNESPRPGQGTRAASGAKTLSNVCNPHSIPNRAHKSITIRAGQKVIGEVRGDTFYKVAVPLRVPPAIATDVSALHAAEYAGAKFMEARDKDTGQIFRTSMSTIWAKGFRLLRGCGEQWGLALDLWARDDEPVIEQLTLL
jgi:hypothetical protein